MSNYIYETLQAHAQYPATPEKIACIENSVKELLKDGEEARQPTLLLGKIQCGKTDTFENIIGLAFDKGIEICVVMTKGTQTLAKQTYKRLVKDFEPLKYSGRIDQKAVVRIYDILDDLKVEGIKQKFVSGKNKVIIVCKKQTDNLNHLISLFDTRCPYLKQKKVLIVDDEADFASCNFVKKSGEITMAPTTSQIYDFAHIPDYCRYLQVTATPYALYLQPDGRIQLNERGEMSPLFRPRHTELVPVHDAYIGGKQYYVDSLDINSMYSHLHHQVTTKCVKVLGKRDRRYTNHGIASNNIESLTYAIISYFMATAIRSIQEEVRGIEYASSAIIHCDIGNDAQKWQSELIGKVIQDIRDGFILDNFKTEDARVKNYVNQIYNDFLISNQKGRTEGLLSVDTTIPSLDDVKAKIIQIFEDEDYDVKVVNAKNDVKALLGEDGQLKLESTANIFIGGNILDRGITINNLLCFFYGRDPKKYQMDTVLQHARMYGSRSKEDMAVTRFHTTAEIKRILEEINAIDEEMRQRIVERKGTILDGDFTLDIIGYSNAVKPCASQKIKISDVVAIKKHARFLPVGFQTVSMTEMRPILKKIEDKLESYPGYSNNDFFLMDKNTAFELLQLISTTYTFKDADNCDLEWHPEEMMAVIDYALKGSTDDNLYIWCPKGRSDNGRDLARLRADGVTFQNAPDDGRSDLAPSKKQAQDVPVLMFIKEKGEKAKGWKDAPFYWPVLIVQKNIPSAIYAINGKVNDTSGEIIDANDLVAGIEAEDILYLPIKAEFFWALLVGEKEQESRVLTDHTASRHLMPSDDPDYPYALSKTAVLDKTKISSINSYNNGIFPYEVKPHKYLLLRNSRDNTGSLLLLKIDETTPYIFTDSKITDNDILVNRQGKTHDYTEDNLTEWTIHYNIEKVCGFKLNIRDNLILEEVVNTPLDVNNINSELYLDVLNSMTIFDHDPYRATYPSDAFAYDSKSFICIDDGLSPAIEVFERLGKLAILSARYRSLDVAEYYSPTLKPFLYDDYKVSSSFTSTDGLGYIAVKHHGKWGILKFKSMNGPESQYDTLQEEVVPIVHDTLEGAVSALEASGTPVPYPWE